MDFGTLKGKTLTDIKKTDDEIIFETNDEKSYRMSHRQDCCETVFVEEVIGEFADLIDSEILLAEEVYGGSNELMPGHSSSGSWTFYKLSTIKGSVTIRWLGESNGYYSEAVDFEEMYTDE